jgi:hypothetical protein
VNRRSIAFRRIAESALLYSDVLVRRWLPDGRREGIEWVARNPRRDDRRFGSFKINLRTGAWGDFATGDCGGDFISLAAFIFDIKQSEAALKIAAAVGVDPNE